MKTPLKDRVHSFNGVTPLKALISSGALVHSYYLYGGAVETQLAIANRQICAHTTNFVVHQFWECLLEDPQRLYEGVVALNEKVRAPHLRQALEDLWYTVSDEYVRGALFFILNRHSTTGAVSSGNIADGHISPLTLHDLMNFRLSNFELIYDGNTDPLLSLEATTDPAVYHLLPLGHFNYNLFDYGKSRGIEATRIDHRKVLDIFKQQKHQMILLYKAHPQLWKNYKDSNITMINAHGIATTSQDHCTEVIIANF